MSTECKEILERNLGSVADWSIKAATHLTILYADRSEFDHQISPDISDFIRRSRPPAKMAIAALGTPDHFRRSRRSAYKIARCVAGLREELT